MAPGEPILYCHRQLFCFVVFRLPAGQTRQVVMFKQESLLAWMNITTWLQERKPRESNKLFDLFFSHKQFRIIRLIRGRKKSIEQGLSMFIALARMVTLRMKVMVCFSFGH